MLPTNHGGAEAVFRRTIDAALVNDAGKKVAGEPPYPVRVSQNGRYFVDQNGEPVFWLGTTQWQLFREYTLDDARTIIEKCKEKGFDFAQVMLMGVGDGTKPNVHGEKPWIDDNPLTPNEAYFQNVDAVLRIAREHNFNISMTLYHQRYRKRDHAGEGPRLGEVAGRSGTGTCRTIVWSMTPEAKPEFVPVLRELAAGLREGRRRRAPDHLQARPRALLLELHPRRELARLQLDADVEERRADLPVRDQGLPPQAGEAGADGGRGLRARLGIRVRRHAAVGPPPGLLLLPGRRPPHLRPQR